MDGLSAVKNPYAHMRQARALEADGKLRSADTEWKHAVRSADSLPLDEYRQAVKTELRSYEANSSYEAQPGVTEASLRSAFSEVLSLPFITRIELASFYARHGAYVDSQETCEEAFLNIPEAFCLDNFRINALHRRALVLRQTLADTLGPEEMEQLFAANFSKLDTDGNGYVHHSELEQAQFDLNLSPDCQLLIRHLLRHYFEVEAAHHDEWGVDIKGITKRDIEAYANRRDSTLKGRAKQQQNEQKDSGRKWW